MHLPKDWSSDKIEAEDARPITGFESLGLMGFPKEDLEPRLLEATGMSDSSMQDVAGNAFSGFVFTPLLLSFLMWLPESVWMSFSGEEKKKTVEKESAETEKCDRLIDSMVAFQPGHVQPDQQGLINLLSEDSEADKEEEEEAPGDLAPT